MKERADFLAGGNLMSLTLRKRKAIAGEASKRYMSIQEGERENIGYKPTNVFSPYTS